MQGPFSREEIQEAFQKLWYAGAVAEDWDAWAERYTEDVVYVDHQMQGTMHGRAAILAWIKPVMQQYGEIYTVYEWHTIDPETGRVIVYMQNRRDDPRGTGTMDFPGLSILQYAGGGRFSRQEDFFSLPQAMKTTQEYMEACAAHDPAHAGRRTRWNWGQGPAWSRGGRSYEERPHV